MRPLLQLLTLTVLLVAGCAPPPTVVRPEAEPMPVGVVAELPFYVAGRRSAFFLDTLGLELERRNMQLVTPPDATTSVVAVVEIGHANFYDVIDVYLAREGKRTCAGRLRLGDTYSTTIDVAADVVAEIIARAIKSDTLGPASCEW